MPLKRFYKDTETLAEKESSTIPKFIRTQSCHNFGREGGLFKVKRHANLKELHEQHSETCRSGTTFSQ